METVGTTRLSFLDRLRDRSTRLGWSEFDERYRELLYRYARRRGVGHDEAEDIVQEVLLNVFQAFDRFQYDRRRGGFRAYLRAAVVHALSRRAVKKARPEVPWTPELLATIADPDEGVDALWEREWQLHRLRFAMRVVAKEFEPSTLEAFRLHVLADWSVEATARHLGLSHASIYQAKSRILKRLRERVNKPDRAHFERHEINP